MQVQRECIALSPVKHTKKWYCSDVSLPRGMGNVFNHSINTSVKSEGVERFPCEKGSLWCKG